MQQQGKYAVMHILTDSASIIVRYNALFNQVLSHFQKHIGNFAVLDFADRLYV